MAYAKANLSKFLARVARGERIVIARYNTPRCGAGATHQCANREAQVRHGQGKGGAHRPAALDPNDG